MSKKRAPVLRDDDQLESHTRAILLARLEKLLKFKRNFRDCQRLYEELKEQKS